MSGEKPKPGLGSIFFGSSLGLRLDLAGRSVAKAHVRLLYPVNASASTFRKITWWIPDDRTSHRAHKGAEKGDESVGCREGWSTGDSASRGVQDAVSKGRCGAAMLNRDDDRRDG
jgi:hypothetical protein